jgi:hypothetical protein
MAHRFSAFQPGHESADPNLVRFDADGESYLLGREGRDPQFGHIWRLKVWMDTSDPGHPSYHRGFWREVSWCYSDADAESVRKRLAGV